MPPGRPTLPTNVKDIRDTLKKSRVNPHEPTPAIEALPCPEHLAGIAREEWERIVPHLVDLGLLAAIDLVALEGYVCCYARWRDAEEVIETEGITMFIPSGIECQRPQVAIAERARKQCLDFLREFGLSPASRGKVRATPKSPGESALDRLKRLKAERDMRRTAKRGA